VKDTSEHKSGSFLMTGDICRYCKFTCMEEPGLPDTGLEASHRESTVSHTQASGCTQFILVIYSGKFITNEQEYKN